MEKRHDDHHPTTLTGKRTLAQERAETRRASILVGGGRRIQTGAAAPTRDVRPRVAGAPHRPENWRRDRGDGEPPLTVACKARKNGAGFAQLEAWLGENDVLMLRRNNSFSLVLLPWHTWLRLLDWCSAK
jgi:hypothetical protein